MKNNVFLYVLVAIFSVVAACSTVEESANNTKSNSEHKDEARARVDSIQQVKPVKNPEKKTHSFKTGPEKKK